MDIASSALLPPNILIYHLTFNTINQSQIPNLSSYLCMQLHPDAQEKGHFKMKATQNYPVQCSMINMTYVIQPMLPNNILFTS